MADPDESNKSAGSFGKYFGGNAKLGGGKLGEESSPKPIRCSEGTKPNPLARQNTKRRQSISEVVKKAVGMNDNANAMPLRDKHKANPYAQAQEAAVKNAANDLRRGRVRVRRRSSVGPNLGYDSYKFDGEDSQLHFDRR